MAELIRLNKVCFSAQDMDILQDVSLEFETAKATAIVGPSGGGKSTVLKIAAGLLVPNRGEVFYKEKNITQMSRSENLDFRRESAFVFQDSALWANQDLIQILELPLKIHFPNMSKMERMAKIKSVSAQVGYRNDLAVRPSRLSMGEQKLIAFARALLCSPSVLFLDEWTESLDENAAERLIDIVKLKKSEGASILFVSHDLRIIKDIADYIVLIVDGKVSIKAPMDQIVRDSKLNEFLRMGIAS